MPRLVEHTAKPTSRWPNRIFALGSVLVATLAGHRASAAVGDYLIDVWTSENGLRSSSVTAIEQTPDGYLWVGTYNGLARFDGVRFVSFDPDNTPALQHARVRKLYVDSVGILWINTYDGSLTSYRDGHFTAEWQGDGSSDATVSLVSTRSNLPVFLLHTGELIRRQPDSSGTNSWQVLHPPGASSGELCAEDGSGVIWCRGRDQQLWRLVGGTFTPVPTNSGLQGRVINSLTADSRGRVWAGTERELAVWDGGRFQTMTPTNGEAVLNIAFLYMARDGDAWVVANGRVRKARDRQWVFEAEACRGVFTASLERLGVQEDRNGGAWFYHYGKGIFHIRPNGRTRQVAIEENFPGERVDCFHEDHEGNLWAGVDRGGLVRMREKRFTVLTPDDPSMARSAVSVAQDREGGIWVGTYGGGLHRLQDGAWQSFALPSGTRRGFVFSVFPDTNDRVWLSAGEEDLFLGSKAGFQPVTPAVHGVKALLAARDGRLWIGTKSGLGSLTDGRFRQFTPEDGVKRTDVRALAEDANGIVWAGAGDGTLYRIETNRVTSFLPEDPLAQQPIWSLLADTDGTVWVGTFRGGLLRFKEGQFVRYTSKHGLPDDVICQILDDGNGSLWIGSQRGIFRVPKSDLNAFARGNLKAVSCTAYGRYDGLPSVECSGSYQPAAWRANDGRLLFTTLKGVVSVQPEELTPNRLPPPVVIEEVLVDGHAETPDEEARPDRASNTVKPAMLEVPPGKRQIELRYTALSFVSPDRVRFRYKLDGLDSDWIEAGSRRYAQYSFLRPGSYTFRVTACNNAGVWNDVGAQLSLQILQHFYQRWWFLALVGIVATGAVAATVHQYVVRGMRRELERVERQRAVEHDRTRIAKDIHDDLGSGLTHIMLLSELARRSPQQEVPAHLTHISDMARELTRAMDETVWAVNPHNDSLDGLMTYVTKFAQDYLNVAGIRCRLDLPAQLPHHALAAEVRHNLFLAVKETLHNVVKHAHATEVWLRLTLQPQGFCFVIADNGCGMVNGKAKSETTQIGRISSGHGLNNLEKRLVASGGRCVVSSEPGQGTRVEFRVILSAAS
jgi:ligand-binding sensor domain-containing protein/signal transduction histidine kinase